MQLSAQELAPGAIGDGGRSEDETLDVWWASRWLRGTGGVWVAQRRRVSRRWDAHEGRAGGSLGATVWCSDGPFRVEQRENGCGRST